MVVSVPPSKNLPISPPRLFCRGHFSFPPGASTNHICSINFDTDRLRYHRLTSCLELSWWGAFCFYGCLFIACYLNIYWQIRDEEGRLYGACVLSGSAAGMYCILRGPSVADAPIDSSAHATVHCTIYSHGQTQSHMYTHTHTRKHFVTHAHTNTHIHRRQAQCALGKTRLRAHSWKK